MTKDLIPLGKDKTHKREFSLGTIVLCLALGSVLSIALCWSLLKGAPSNSAIVSVQGEVLKHLVATKGVAHHVGLAQVETILPESLTLQFIASKRDAFALSLNPDWKIAYDDQAQVDAPLEDSNTRPQEDLKEEKKEDDDVVYLSSHVDPLGDRLVRVTLKIKRLDRKRDVQVGQWVNLRMKGPSENLGTFFVPEKSIIWINGQPHLEVANAGVNSGEAPFRGLASASDVLKTSRVKVELVSRRKGFFQVYSESFHSGTLFVEVPRNGSSSKGSKK
jgi:hypothetical protein